MTRHRGTHRAVASLVAAVAAAALPNAPAHADGNVEIGLLAVSSLRDSVTANEVTWVLDREDRVARIEHAVGVPTAWRIVGGASALVGGANALFVITAPGVVPLDPLTLAPQTMIPHDDYVVCEGAGAAWAWSERELHAFVGDRHLQVTIEALEVGEKSCMVQEVGGVDHAWLAMFSDGRMTVLSASADAIETWVLDWAGGPRARLVPGTDAGMPHLVDLASGSRVDARRGTPTDGPALRTQGTEACARYDEAGASRGCLPRGGEAVEEAVIRRTPEFFEACHDDAGHHLRSSWGWHRVERTSPPSLTRFRVPSGTTLAFVRTATESCAILTCEADTDGARVQVLDGAHGGPIAEARLTACPGEAFQFSGRASVLDSGTTPPTLLTWDRRALATESLPDALASTPALGPARLRLTLVTTHDVGCAGQGWALERHADGQTTRLLGPRCEPPPRLVPAWISGAGNLALLGERSMLVDWSGEVHTPMRIDASERPSWVALTDRGPSGIVAHRALRCPSGEGCARARVDLSPESRIETTREGEWIRLKHGHSGDVVRMRFVEGELVVLAGRRVWADEGLLPWLAASEGREGAATPLFDALQAGWVRWDAELLVDALDVAP